MSRASFPQVRRLRTIGGLRARLEELGLALGVDDAVEPAPDGPLARPLEVDGLRIGNRFCILPMEGWDGTAEGRPTDLVRRRWQRFGQSGAKLVWGGEAVAVRADGRANPHQLRIGPDTIDDLGELRQDLVDAHLDATGAVDDLVVGLQLTHSGRWSRPHGPPAPVLAYHHPILDARVEGAPACEPLSDDALDELVGDYVEAARLAHDAGFDFVDVKACHGYLGHELLSAVDRPGRYGGPLERRAAFLLEVVRAVRNAVPGLHVGVRLSVFDLVPFRPGDDGVGQPQVSPPEAYPFAFGGDGTGTGVDLAEPLWLVDRLAEAGVRLLCVTAGSPYYVPHVQRPAFFPPSDGYAPPEDPIVGVARLVAAAREITARHADVVVVGSGYSYLQEWVAHVAQHEVRTGGVHAVGLGRMALSYPDLPADVLAGRPLDRARLCRTFSDCTTAPRNGLVSGCYPLDPFFKDRPERRTLAAIKRTTRASVEPESSP